MTIRKLTEQDAQAVSELIITTMRVSNVGDYPAELMEELVKAQTPEHVLQQASWTHFYVAEEAGSIIGCGAIGPYWGKEDESSLFSIFVHPDFQGKGIGRAIVKTLEEDPFAIRARRIEIPASITGLPFYRKMGYTFKNGNDTLDEERLYRLEKYPGAPEVRRIEDPDEKERIAREILEALTDWFEIPETREEYIRNSRGEIFFAAERNDRQIGFLCLKETGKATAELAVMGVLKPYHRHGIGRALFEAARETAAAAGYEFMQVKTVAMGYYEDYDRTNRFYRSLGFKELEVIPEIWGPENPCQIYVQSLRDPEPAAGGAGKHEKEDDARSSEAELRGKDFSLRKVTTEDYDAIYALWTSTEQSRRALNPVDDARDGIARYLDRNPDTCFAAVKEGKIIGVILAGHDGRRGIIHHLCVHPQFRRQGVAGTLVAAAEEALRREGIQKVFGLVFKDNEPANGFWESRGYSLRTNLNYRNKSLNSRIPAGE